MLFHRRLPKAFCGCIVALIPITGQYAMNSLAQQLAGRSKRRERCNPTNGSNSIGLLCASKRLTTKPKKVAFFPENRFSFLFMPTCRHVSLIWNRNYMLYTSFPTVRTQFCSNTFCASSVLSTPSMTIALLLTRPRWG